MNKILKAPLAALAALFLLSLFAKEAAAGFTVCNRRVDGMWVSYSSYSPNIPKIYLECSESGRSGGCYYSAWRTVGWWRLEPNQCAVVRGGNLTNRFNYVYIESDQGARLVGANVPFYVRDPAFGWDEYAEEHLTGGACIGSSAVYDFCTPSGYNVNFKEIDSGSYTNFTLNIN